MKPHKFFLLLLCGSFWFLPSFVEAQISNNPLSNNPPATSCNISLTINNQQSSYNRGDVVSYTWVCTSGAATYVKRLLQKPDGIIDLGDFTSSSGNPGPLTFTLPIGQDYVAGVYTLKVCLNSACSSGTAAASFNVVLNNNVNYLPTNFTATQSGSAIKLNWTSPATLPPIYQIERRTASGTYQLLINSLSGTATSYIDSISLTSGSNYYYKIYPCSSSSTCSTEGVESNVVTFSTSSATVSNIPPPPASLSVTLTSPTSVSFAWPSVAGAELYNVYRSSVNNPDVWTTVIIGTPAIMGTQLNISAGTYKYRVESCIANYGCSGAVNNQWIYSEAVTVPGSTAVPPAPSNMRAEANTSAGILLRWNDNAINEDKYNLERKLSGTTDWSGAVRVQLQGANIKEYLDTTITPGLIYDYRLQVCLSGTGCSAYTYLLGVTAGGGASLDQEYRAVTVKMANNIMVPYGAVTFTRDGTLLTASLINAASTVIYLLPGEYNMLPSFAGVDSETISLIGPAVSNRKLNLTTANTEIIITLPQRLAVNVLVNNSAGQPVAGARLALNIPVSTAYAASYTDSSGAVQLELPPGTYQGVVTKEGYLPQTFNWIISETAREFVVRLESLQVSLSGKVLAGSTPISAAVVRAQNTDSGLIVIAKSDAAGQYTIYLKNGNWHLYALAEGYSQGDGGVITINNIAQTRDLALGEAKELLSSSANIVPTVPVTVRASDLGVTIGLPANSLGNQPLATVTIRQSTKAVSTSAATPLAGTVRDVSAVISGSPITALAASASIEFDYSDNDLVGLGITPAQAAGLKLAYWHETNNDWQILSSVVDTANRKVRAATNHFTIFAIVLPFLVQPAAAQTTSAAPAVEPLSMPTDERAAQFAAILAEGTKVYVLGPEALANSVNKNRDLALEAKYNAEIVSRVVGADNIALGIRTAVLNFITYGTASTIALGAGERGGVVASFRAAYGHLPNSEYEWQEILKIANGRWPGTLLPEREQAMKSTFRRVYLREAVVTNANDSAALAIMAYGLRSAKRNLISEAAAITTFRTIYGYSPVSATDWDTVRAISYSGAKR